MSFKIFFCAVFCVLAAGVHSAAIPHDSTFEERPASFLAAVHYGELPEDGMYYEYIQPVAVLDQEAPTDLEHHHERHRRQVSATISGGSDGNLNYQWHASKPIIGNDKHMLSAGISAITSSGSKKMTTGLGLDYENVIRYISYSNNNGHGASLSGRNIPGLGNQLTAAGRLNLLNTDKHRLDANVFHTRTFLENHGPTLKTNGGSLDYLFNNRHGASFGMSNTDLLKSTTYSGTGKFNLFKSPTSSFDLTAGLSKTSSPFMRPTGWQPNFGFSFSKHF